MEKELNYFLKQIEGKDLYEWRSKKALENFLSENRREWKVIGYVTPETLRKWGEENIDKRGLYPIRHNIYIVQNNYTYFYLDFNGPKKYYYKNYQKKIFLYIKKICQIQIISLLRHQRVKIIQVVKVVV